MKVRHSHDLLLEREPRLKLPMPHNSLSALLTRPDGFTVRRPRKTDRWILQPLPKAAEIWLTKVFRVPLPPSRFFRPTAFGSKNAARDGVRCGVFMSVVYSQVPSACA